MDINKEIEKIIEYQNSTLPQSGRKTREALEEIINQVKNDYEQGNYDFKKSTHLAIKQGKKVRHTRSFEIFSCEETLCIYLKRLLDRKFYVKYPNRNEYIHSLFDIVSALKNMNDYVIFKFDFTDFFNSVSSEYVYKKYISQRSFERYQNDLLALFVEQTKYAYAGLNTSNIICEIIANRFDELLSMKLQDQGLIFYRRYIDDGILIFNQRISQDDCYKVLNEVIDSVFLDDSVCVTKRCTTQLNLTKTKYISVFDLAANNKTDCFDFLGYEFVLSPSRDDHNNKLTTKFQYGITQKKIDKYTKKVDDIVKEYMKHNDLELLRHQLKAFCCRTVYQIPKYKTLVWKTKGFIANYQELRFRLDQLTPKTKNFMKSIVFNVIKANAVPFPYFLKTNSNESAYSLYNNMEKYRTLLFVEPIGINKEGLKKLCKQLGIWDCNKDYDGLVRDYLIKVGVGH